MAETPAKFPELDFDRLIAGNDSVDVKEIDVAQYVSDAIKERGDADSVGVFNCWVEYQHVFSDSEVVKVPFAYLYVPSAMQLRRILLQKTAKGKKREDSG
jgi:hypothetical protein